MVALTFPTPHTVGHHAYSAGGPDPHRNPPSYTPPIDEPGEAVAVYGWHVPSTTEPKIAGHDRVIVDVELLVPPEFIPGPHDRIDLPTGQFEVVGEVQDYNHGPFGWHPGSVINLRKVDG
jgi:hypothetical protein